MNQTKKTSTRKRVERNITQDLKTEHYLVTQYNGYDDKGAIRRTVTCETLQEARAIRDKHEFGRKYEGKATINPKITVTQCIEQYISEKNLAS